MTGADEPIEETPEEDPGGDCSRYVMVCEFTGLEECYGLSARERHVLLDLVMLVGPLSMTGEVPHLAPVPRRPRRVAPRDRQAAT